MAADGIAIQDPGRDRYFDRRVSPSPEKVSYAGGNADVPLLGFAQAGADGYFDDARFPAGYNWEQVTLAAGAGEGAYALQVQGDSMLPLYRDGDVVIVDPAAQLRKGDRVVAKTVAGEVTAKILARMTSKVVELQSLNPNHRGRTIPANHIVWMARIVRASQ